MDYFKEFQIFQPEGFIGAQLKCLYANVHSRGNEQEELKNMYRTTVIGIMEMWIDSCDLNGKVWAP